MIELTIEQARAIAAAPLDLDRITPETGDALLVLVRAIRSYTGEQERKSLFDQLLDSFKAGLREAESSTSPRPKWEYLAPAVRYLRTKVAEDPQSIARTDRVGAYIRDTFDAIGLSVRDEDTLYVAISTAGLLVEMASTGQTRGQVSRHELESIAAVAQTFAASLIPYLPDEVTR